jgi:hypothetical protein
MRVPSTGCGGREHTMRSCLSTFGKEKEGFELQEVRQKEQRLRVYLYAEER